MIHFRSIFVFKFVKDGAVVKIQLFYEAEDKRRPEPALTIPFPLLFPDPALTIPYSLLFPEPVLTMPFPVNKFPNKLAPRVPSNILKNPPFCYFISFSIVLVTPFNRTLESSRACTIFIISFISSFEIIKVVFPDPNTFLCIPASAADAAAVNPKGIIPFWLIV